MIAKFLMTFLAITIGLLPPDNWKAETSRAKIEFSVKGPFGTVHGNFSGLKASIQFNEKDPATGSLTASVEVKTISTGIKLRNSDLRNKEIWFNADKYPLISFKSNKIEKAKDGYKAEGLLTMKGVTKPVAIPFTFSKNAEGGVFKGRFTVKRQDFHMGKEGGSVGSDVTIELELPVTK